MSADKPFSVEQYNIREDVRTLAEARRIEADSKRLKAARTEAKRMLAEQQKQQNAIAEVATGNPEDPH